MSNIQIKLDISNNEIVRTVSLLDVINAYTDVSSNTIDTSILQTTNDVLTDISNNPSHVLNMTSSFINTELGGDATQKIDSAIDSIVESIIDSIIENAAEPKVVHPAKPTVDAIVDYQI
jgi:hypothetical protein